MAHERSRHLARTPPAITGRPGIHYCLGGAPVVSFCSNDYLGLLSDPPHLHSNGSAPHGSSGSRLICGNHELTQEVEQAYATHFGCEDAVLFPSGYQAALAAIPTLIEPLDHIFSDRLNHASLIDAIRLSRSKTTILPHLEPPPFPQKNSPHFPWWITESTFSMDGDQTSRRKLTAFQQAGGFTVVDEAHSIGLFSQGRGYTYGSNHRPTVLLCPLGKAFASTGAFVASSRTIAEYLRTHARSYVYSTGPSPALAAHLLALLPVISGPIGEQRRQDLLSNIRQFSQLLQQSNTTPIFPIIVGSNELALSLSASLLRRGWHVQAIRPPTVAPQSSRLRITISASHTSEQLQTFAHDLFDSLSSHNIPYPPAPKHHSIAAPTPIPQT